MRSADFINKLNFFENLNKQTAQTIIKLKTNNTDNKIPVQLPRIAFNCPYCEQTFISPKEYDTHIIDNHTYYEDNIQICEKCNMIFENNDTYNGHLNDCDSNNLIPIPTDPNGQYICPTCGNKYVNAFFLGEHFTVEHNDYDIMRKLDNKLPSGFPGFKILKKINMINITKMISDICDICKFDFDKHKIPLKLTCCNHLICKDCLSSHISISDSLICPYCVKDHTYIKLDYITFIKETNITDKEKWIPWWENHMELFN